MRNCKALIITVMILLLSVLKAEGANYLDVSIYTWNDGTPGIPYDSPSRSRLQDPAQPNDTEMTFAGDINPYGPPPYGNLLNNPWVVSDQFVRIRFDCDMNNWGISIMTDNRPRFPAGDNVAPKILGITDPDGIHGTADDSWDPGPNGTYESGPGSDDVYGFGSDGIPGTEDDTVNVAFGGMINQQTRNSPNNRILLAWQVFEDADHYNQPTDIYWYGTPTPNFPFTWNVGDNGDPRNEVIPGIHYYPYEWAYMSDKSNVWGTSRVLPGPPRSRWERKHPGDSLTDGYGSPSYEISVIGNQSGAGLAQYPPASMIYPPQRLKSSTDDDVVVYFAACYCVPSSTEEGRYEGIVSLGMYETVIYIELVFE